MTLGLVGDLRVGFRERGAGDLGLGLVADVEGCWTEIVGVIDVDVISSRCADSLIESFSVMRYTRNGLGIVQTKSRKENG
jgi:hypothetical protein